MSFKFDILDNHKNESEIDTDLFDQRIEVSDTSKSINEMTFEDYEKLDTKELLNIFNNHWNELNIDDKRDVSYLLSEKVCDDLNIKDRPLIYFGDLGEGNYGGYSADDNSIVINELYMNDGPELANTIAHEERHAWQQMRYELPENKQNDFDKALKDNMDNYIDSSDNYFAYENQPIEVDAKNYANSFIERYGGGYNE